MDTIAAPTTLNDVSFSQWDITASGPMSQGPLTTGFYQGPSRLHDAVHGDRHGRNQRASARHGDG